MGNQITKLEYLAHIIRRADDGIRNNSPSQAQMRNNQRSICSNSQEHQIRTCLLHECEQRWREDDLHGI